MKKLLLIGLLFGGMAQANADATVPKADELEGVTGTNYLENQGVTLQSLYSERPCDVHGAGLDQPSQLTPQGGCGGGGGGGGLVATVPYISCDIKAPITLFRNEEARVRFHSDAWNIVRQMRGKEPIYWSKLSIGFNGQEIKTSIRTATRASVISNAVILPPRTGTFTAYMKHTISKWNNGSWEYKQTDTCERKVTVIERTRPVISRVIPTNNPHNVYQGDVVNIKFTATDAANDIASFTYKIGNSTHACQSKTSCEVKYTAPSDWTGTQAIVFSATDAHGLTGSSSIYIRTLERNTAPVVSLSAASNIVNQNSEASFTLTAKDNDNVSGNKLSKLVFCAANSCSDIPFKDTNICSLSGKQYTCNIKRTVENNTKFTAYAKDGGNLESEQKSVDITVNVKPHVAIKVQPGSHVFAGEAFTVYLETQSNDIKYARICKIARGDVNTDVPRDCALDNNGNLNRHISYKTCTNVTSGCSWALTAPEHQDTSTYYAYIEDTMGLADADKIMIVTRPPYGIRIGSGVSQNVPFGGNVNFRIVLGGFSSTAHTLTHLQLKTNEVAQSYQFNVGGKTYHVASDGLLSSPLALPTVHDNATGGTITVNASWSASLTGDVGLRLYGRTSKGKTSTSELFSTRVIPPAPEAVSSVSLDPKSQGAYLASTTPAEYATGYRWREYVKTPGSGTFTLRNEFPQGATVLNNTYSYGYSDHGSKVKVCVVAYNAQGDSGETCSVERTVDNPEPTPNKPLFSSAFGFGFSAPYDVTWQANSDAHTVRYILYGWAGTAAHKPASPVKLYDGAANHFRMNQPELGQYTYQIAACNSHGTCVDGAYQTVSHNRALISNVTRTGYCKTRNCLEIQGSGLSTEAGRFSIRAKLDATVFSYSATTAQRLDNYTLAINVNESVISNFEAGGLTLSATNGVKSEFTQLFHTHADTPNSSTALIDNPIVTSRSGRTYTTQSDKLIALGDDYWEFKAGGTVTTPALLDHEQSPNVFKDTLYIGSSDHSAYAVNHAGQQIWQMQTRGPIEATPLVSREGDLYIGSTDKALYSVDAESGAVLWSYEFPYPVKEQVTLVGEDVYVTIEADKQDPSDIGSTIVYVLDRETIGLNALRWDDIDGTATSKLRELLEGSSVGWQPNESHNGVQTLTRLFYILFKRAPSKEELTFMAFAYSNQIPLKEIINALLTSEHLIAELPGTLTSQQFVDLMLTRFFPAGAPQVIAGKTVAQWAAYLSQGGKRADLIEKWVTTAQVTNRLTPFTHSVLYYFYGHCLADSDCDQNKVADSDLDGVSDYIEIHVGSDPQDPADGIRKPYLVKSDNNLAGSFNLSLDNFNNKLTYQLFEQTSPDNQRKEFKLDKQQVALTRPNGIYTYQAQGCFSATIEGQEYTACTALSDSVTVHITDSLQESNADPIKPEDKRYAFADYHRVSDYQLKQSVLLSSTPGNFRVNESGAATYQVPIVLPAGIAGNTPEVSLGYSSQAPESLLGMGWSLNATSSISRCRQTYAQDGQFRALSFDEHSRFCLDGQRLILQSGEQGQTGAEYVTEIRDFSEIKIVSHPESGLKAFRVRGKDGSTRYYGGTEDSLGHLDPYDKTSPVISWMLSSVYDNVSHSETGIRDRDGKTAIKYTYGTLENATADTSTDVVLHHIEYSGNKVVFDYQSGPVRNASYIQGFLQRQSAELTAIKVRNHEGTLLRQYKLAFERDRNNQVRQLKEVKECTSSGTCRRPIVFDYEARNNNLSFAASDVLAWQSKVGHTFVDVLGDGKPALATLSRSIIDDKVYNLCLDSERVGHVCTSIRRSHRAEYVPMAVVDYDQDGKQSLWVNIKDDYTSETDTYWREYYYEHGAIKWRSLPLTKSIHSGGGGGGGDDFLFGNDPALTSSASFDFSRSDEYMTDIRLADVNGDGHADIIHKRGDKSKDFYVRYWSTSTQRFLARKRITDGANQIVVPNTEDSYSFGSESFERVIHQKLDNNAYHTLDFNFDGLSDLLSMVCFGKCDDVEDIDGFVLYLNSNHSNSTGSTYFEQAVMRKVRAKHLMPIDFNGDGLVDLIYYDITRKYWQLEINTSSTSASDKDVLNVSFTKVHEVYDNKGEVRPLAADLDRNGRVELYFKQRSSTSWQRYDWDPAALTFERTDHTLELPEFDPKEGEGVYFADYDFDGITDLIHHGSEGLQVKLNHFERFQQGLLTSVTQGFGITTSIEYGLMNDTNLYTKEAGDSDLPESRLSIQTLVGAMPLVRKVTTDAPTMSTPDNKVSVNYHYGGNRVQFGGRGSLGFANLTTSTEKDGSIFTTTTQYNQGFPFVGMPRATIKYVNDTLISYSSNTYYHSTPALTGVKSYQVYNDSVSECQAEMDNNDAGEWSIAQFRCSTTKTVQDIFGNAKSISNTTYLLADSAEATAFVESQDKSPYASKQLESVVTSSNFGTVSEQKLGRLQWTEVTTTQDHNGQEESLTKRSEFAYYSSEPLKGMLKHEKIVLPEQYKDTNEACTIETTTTHEYDGFGNKTKVSTAPTLSSGNALGCKDYPARVSITNYDAQGRYVTSTENGVFTEQTIVSVNSFGQPRHVKDSNGVSTYFYYDALGALVGKYNATGSQSKTLRVGCGTNDQGYCAYSEQKYVNNTLVGTQFIDKFGRPYKTIKYDVLGKGVESIQSYDAHGRVLMSSTGNLKPTVHSYNEFDQLHMTDDQNAGIKTTYSRDGNVATVTLSGDLPGGIQKNKSIYDDFGRVVQVDDAQGNTLTYTYDISGNRLTVQSSADNNQIISKIEYDYLGRKTKMIDKDSGTWEYQYNAYGELVWQKDARGVITEVSYDQLGRRISSSVTGELTSEFVYSTTKPHQLEYEQIGQWRKSYYYDGFGRAIGAVTDLESALNCTDHVMLMPGINDLRIKDTETAQELRDPISSSCVIQQTIYDGYGRAVQQFDDYRRLANGDYVDARGTRTVFQQGRPVARVEAREGEYGRTYYRVAATNALGQVTRYVKGGQTMTIAYDERGRLTNKSASNAAIIAEAYTFDGLGNLTSKQTGYDNQSLTYTYDTLNRLQEVTHGTNVTHDYDYDANGNLILKDGWVQEYGKAGKPLHAIASRSRVNPVTSQYEQETFGYDANGNQTSVDKNGSRYRDVVYSGRNKAIRISANGETVTFKYDANNRRYKRTDNEQTVYYVGALELTTPKSGEHTAIKRYVGNDVIQTYNAQGQGNLKWLFTNYQGSIVAITNSKFELLKRFKYDAFGKQSEVFGSDTERQINFAESATLLGHLFGNVRGYTGHESLKLGDDNRVIHMNGRLYDSGTGRFMQADPVVQAPTNLQNYNRYSYVLNNPMSYTDPSGYFFKKLLKVTMKVTGDWYIHKFLNKVPWLKSITSVALNFIPGCQVWCTAAFNAKSTFVATGSLNGALKAGAIAAASAYAFSQIGDAFGADSGFWQNGGAAHIGAHALTGGIVSELQGGKFGHGFFSAGLTKGAQVAGLVSMDNVIIGTAQSMVVAGTISKLTGGKFANAAVTGAFQYLYNAVRGKGAAKLGKDLADLLSGRKPTRNEQIVEFASELVDAGFSQEEALSRANKRYGGRKLPFTDNDRLTEINKTLDRIDTNGPFPHNRDGITFRNREGKLPEGNYKEYTVNTPGASNRGARRVVRDQDTGNTYYTDDHYKNFIQIEPKKY
ncbi:ribonuclease domain-containing protein [Pseudoalteromonas rubra]|uniref:ribonuclease domain-containing protein n=1 Tax=Pseudoalteromonas rubra TaxID=43658 RepID=UPI000F77445D|nr:ribonuclease domain-containing protein [Pseudoalteromonas rubra]